MRERMRRAVSRLQCTPVVFAGVVIFITAVMAAGWIREHAAAVDRGLRYAMAAILVLGAAGIVALVTTAVSRKPVIRQDEDEPDMAPFQARDDGSTWGRLAETARQDIIAPAAVVSFPRRAPEPDPAPESSDRSEVPR